MEYNKYLYPPIPPLLWLQERIPNKTINLIQYTALFEQYQFTAITNIKTINFFFFFSIINNFNIIALNIIHIIIIIPNN